MNWSAWQKQQQKEVQLAGRRQADISRFAPTYCKSADGSAAAVHDSRAVAPEGGMQEGTQGASRVVQCRFGWVSNVSWIEGGLGKAGTGRSLGFEEVLGFSHSKRQVLSAEKSSS